MARENGDTDRRPSFSTADGDEGIAAMSSTIRYVEARNKCDHRAS